MIKNLTAYLIPAVVLVVLGLYVLASTGGLAPGIGFGFLALLALGVFGVVGSVELGRRLDPKFETARGRVGVAFGVAAFAIFVVVMVVQFGARLLWQEDVVRDAAAGLQDGQAMLKLAYLSVNAVQATMDVAFDVFYCLMVILYSSLMLTDRSFGRTVGAFGLLAAGGLLALNLITFPLPPAEAGLVDLGPATGLWWIAVIVLWIRSDRARERSGAAGA